MKLVDDKVAFPPKVAVPPVWEKVPCVLTPVWLATILKAPLAASALKTSPLAETTSNLALEPPATPTPTDPVKSTFLFESISIPLPAAV